VESGQPFAAAYAAESGVFPRLYVRLVDAGERAGDLAGTLEQIADHAARTDEVRGRMRGALVYPLMTAGCVLAVGLAAVAFASPTLWGYAEEVSGHSPLPIVAIALTVLAVVVGAIVLLAWGRPGRGKGSHGLPPGTGLGLLAALASLASTLALLLRRRIPLPDALALAAESGNGGEVDARVRAMADTARGGSGLAASMRAGALFEPSLLWLVETGEQAGAAADALEDVAGIYRQRLRRGIDRFTVLLQPAAELVIGIVVFVIAYSFLVPIFEYTRSVLWL
jgi:type II secretory pathway component PulF